MSDKKARWFAVHSHKEVAFESGFGNEVLAFHDDTNRRHRTARVIAGYFENAADTIAGSMFEQKGAFAFELANANLFAFAGLWDAWKDNDDHWLQSFAIVTAEANELMARIHPRVPVSATPIRKSVSPRASDLCKAAIAATAKSR